MPLTAATAATEVAKQNPSVDAKLELCTNFSGSSSWVEYPYKTLKIRYRDDQSISLEADLINAAFAYSDETNQGVRTQIKGLARVTGQLGAETKVLFLGRTNQIGPEDQKFSLSASCYREDLNETRCEIYREPDTIEVTDSTRRIISQIDPDHQPHVYGFVPDGSGTDPAFDEASQTRRRSWVRNGTVEIWKDAVSTDTDDQLTPSKFNIDWTSGVVEIYIPVGELASDYYIEWVDAYLETFATAAANCDFARVMQDMLTFSAVKRGPGFVLGTHFGNPVVSVNAGLKQIVIAGDYRKWYPDNCQVFVQPNPADGTGNTYTVNGTPSYGGGNTTITVDQVPAVPVGDAVISRDTGFDIDRALSFNGKCQTVLSTLASTAQQNLKLWFHPDTGRFWFFPVEQSSTPTASLVHARTIGVPRDDRDFFTSIIRTGQTGFPINDVHQAAVDGNLTDITTGTPSFFKWDGQNISMDGSAFADVQQYLYDGDANKACMAHELTAPADVDGDASSKYIGWYYFCQVDLGESKNINRCRVTMPGSRNPNAGAGNQGIFWPGVKIEISDDNVNWFLLSVDLYGHYSPGSQIDVTKDRIQRQRGRYVRVLCGAYKEGDSNQSDPAIGLAEFELYTSADYQVVREISPLHTITAVDMATDYFEIDDDRLTEWADGDTFKVIDSTGNDGNYTLLSHTLVSGRVRLFVAAVPNGVADGRLYTTTDYTYLNNTAVKRDYPNLWTRFGDRFKESEEDFGSKYSIAVAGDVALKTFEEALRMMQEVNYTAVHDMRHDMYDTLAGPDEMNAVCPIVSANSGTDVFVVAGNHAERFASGLSFRANGTGTTPSNDATYTSTGATYDPDTNQTTISVAAVPATQGAAGYLFGNVPFLLQEMVLTFSNKSLASSFNGVNYKGEIPA